MLRPVGVLALLAAMAFVSAQAGDILRGGASSAGAKRNAEARASSGAEAANVARTTARDRLSRTTAAITAVRAMQTGVQPSVSVPDGLAAGGLQRATGVNARWTGALAPEQSGNTVNIQQTDAQAVLHWEKFNVGRNTTLNFDQSAGKTDAGKWIAFNKVFDPSGQPSQILGSIKAQGQVYVINQNGIIFGAGSQVNTRTFVASSLPINDNLIERGILNQESGNVQFLFSAVPTGSFVPPAPLTVDGRVGDVVVEAGASLSSTVSEEGYGGQVMLVGPNVRNAGVISTPAGQTILASGLQVGLEAHNSGDPSLRGLDVYVGQINSPTLGEYSAESINTGLIESARGNIVMAGKRVRQMGVLESSTSVDVNGRIELMANYDALANQGYDATSLAAGAPFLSRSSGLVELGVGSVVRILPEWENSKSIAQSSLPLRSAINMQGQSIHLAREAQVLAPNAEVKVDAGEWIYESSPQSTAFVYSSGQIYMDEGSYIDVAGSTDVYIPLAQSIITLQLRGSELADSPLQRDGNLRAADLVLDLRTQGSFYGREWVGTPLGDATGYLNLVERNAAQLSMEGGDITLRAGGSVVVRKGAVLDASGGYARNEGGKIQTTRIRLGRRILDVSEATPDRVYDGIYEGAHTETSSKWGVSKKFSHPLSPLNGYTQNEYIEGANAGSISITASSMAIDGELAGRTVIGPRQLRETTASSALPRRGSLSLIFESEDKEAVVPKFGTVSPTAPRIVFSRNRVQKAPDAFSANEQDIAMALSGERLAEVRLSPELLNEQGFGTLLVRNSDGDIFVDPGTVLQAPPGGEIDLSGANVLIDGSIVAPGGNISITAYNYSPYRAEFLVDGDLLPAASPNRGVIRLSAGSLISAAGLTVDDRPTALNQGVVPISSDGGSVTLEAFSIDLAEGSEIDVSGGQAYGVDGKHSYGDAGSISILAGQDPNLTGILGGRLALGARLSGFSGAHGGSLSIKAPMIQVGGNSSRKDVLLVAPSFFNEGGFSRFELTGIGEKSVLGGTQPALLIAPGTLIEPVVSSLVSQPFAADGKPVFRTLLKPVGLRDPVSLSFRATGAIDSQADLPVARGDIVFGDGAVIRTDPLGEVVLDGETVEVYGSIFAPGGRIEISGADSFPLASPSPIALPTVYIGPRSVLSAAGTTLLLPDSYGRLRGSVLPGGSIEVSGNILAESGALLDVSGAAGILDLTPSELGLVDSPQVSANSGLNAPLDSLRTISTLVESDGGSIALHGSELLVSEATLVGRPGGPTAIGGFLSVSSGRYVAESEPSTSADINLVVQQSGRLLGRGARGVGIPVADAQGATIKGMGFFIADQFAAGGFSSLELGGNVRFKGDVSISAEKALLVADGGVIEADSNVNLSAAYIRVGQEFPEPKLSNQQDFLFTQINAAGTTTEYHPVPNSGLGRLTLSAPLIDVGTLVLEDIGYAEFAAINGDIRGNGTLVMEGDLVLRAGQIYPTTAGNFEIFVYDTPAKPGSVTIENAGSRPLPYSAGGRLTVMASMIHQGGTLRAPFGSIALGWDGILEEPSNAVVGDARATPVTTSLDLGPKSLTSVSAIDPFSGEGVILPYGRSTDGLVWIDPSGLDVTLSGLPGKSVSLSAQNLNLQGGSLIDIRGGGDLYAYRWVQGLGGFSDILASETSYAVIPDYEFSYSPYAAFNSSADELSGDKGYANSQLGVGDQITLKGSSALPAGTYTLLPARYALMPGAVLVTPSSSKNPGVTTEDGALLVAGYRSNSLVPGKSRDASYSTYEVLTGAMVRERAQYEDYFASDFLRAAAADRGLSPQRLPVDSGRLSLLATTGLVIAGDVLAKPANGGRGAFVDIAAEGDIWIGTASEGAAATPGAIVLDASRLTAIGAESLLIGGYRTNSSESNVTVRATSITLDNRGETFAAPEIIMAASESVTLAAGSSIASFGGMTMPAADLQLTGDGALVRVSADRKASILRTGFTGLNTVNLSVGDGARISGGSITLDSTYQTDLSPLAVLDGRAVNLNSGRISFLLDNPDPALPAYGLVMEGGALRSLGSAESLAFLSYSSIDFYGTGVLPIGMPASLALRAGEIRGFNQAGGTVIINAGDLLLDNSQGAASGAPGVLSGSLELNARTLRIGSGILAVNRFSELILNAPGGIFGSGIGGIAAGGNIVASTSALTAAGASQQSLTADGDIFIASSGGLPEYASGLGATYGISGRSVRIDADILLPSGQVNISSLSGDIFVGGRIDVSGRSQQFFDVSRHTDGGKIALAATDGDVTLLSGGILDLSAPAAGGNAGTLDVKAPAGSFNVFGRFVAAPGAGEGRSGSVVIDALSLGNFDNLNASLDSGSFFESRVFRARSGDVTVGLIEARARNYEIAVDFGSLTVLGTINASGVTGGSIRLSANGDVILESGSRLTVAASIFDAAGKGGQVTIEAGTQRNGLAGPGFLEIENGSEINLSVASLVPGDAQTPGSSAFYGQFGGKLHLRAPQNAAGTDLNMGAIEGSITGASSILVEGYRIFDLTNTTGASAGIITNAGTINAAGGLLANNTNVQGSVRQNGINFLAAAGSTVTSYNNYVTSRFLATSPDLASIFVLAPGAEIINRNGNLTLGSASSTSTSDWNLATFRYGAKSAPGVLTMRAAGDMVFYNALSDGFSGGSSLWLSPLMAQNSLLPVNSQSWSYRLTAGADLSSADFRATNGGNGSLKLGKNYGNATIGTSGANALTSTIVATRFQPIRTGSGDITITAAGDVQLLNQFATIYTAGTQVASPTTLFTAGDFVLPILTSTFETVTTVLGRQQTPYLAQYAMAGGNVSIVAGNNIEHLTRDSSGLIDDSSRQLPSNWLYRRGYVDPETGQYGESGAFASTREVRDPSSSTTWWVDYSNFFEGIGTLGGGNITLVAGNDVKNIDAAAPTNARAASGVPDPDKIVELGGGDVSVLAGRDINGGVYYVERGHGLLSADGSITTNSTRSPSLGIVGSSSNLNDPLLLSSDTWLATTLFLGRGGFDVKAAGDVLLGPVANTSLLPSGIANKYWYKTYFSTYGDESFVNVLSLGGDVIHRLEVTIPGESTPLPALQAWMQTQSVFSTQSDSAGNASNYQPWLRLSDSEVRPFSTFFELMPATLRSTALSGSIKIVGDLTLSPSPSGTLELIAADDISGLFGTGISSIAVAGSMTNLWTASTINVSDADPINVPGMFSPLAFFGGIEKSPLTGLPVAQTAARSTSPEATVFQNSLAAVSASFGESGSYVGSFGVVQTKQALHSDGILHAGDPNPVRIFANAGDISGLTLFSPKKTQIIAGNDITDIAFYIQNVDEKDTSFVSAGRDIKPYDANTTARISSMAEGNLITAGEAPLAGDIQISGPGVLEVLAGRDIDLGTGPANADGTGVGITSIGNARNPFLPFSGASLFVGAGMGPSAGLANAGLDFEEFVGDLLEGGTYAEELGIIDVGGSLSPEEEAQLAVRLLYLILRDVGIDYASTGSYEAGFDAIESLFGTASLKGDINTRNRDIRTKSGGAIHVFVPGGQLTMAQDNSRQAASRPTIGRFAGTGALRLFSSETASNAAPSGIVTEYGGGISIFSKGDIEIGQGRIFTLRGGSIVIWSSEGDIAAGAAAKTVATAPPTRVLIDPQSATVETDLSGLATGGGIGQLQITESSETDDSGKNGVFLIAPNGTVDAGDAGIRATGDITIAAVSVLNADNISAGGSTVGVPATPTVAAPNIGGLTSASSASGAASSAANQVADQSRPQPAAEEAASIFEVEVLGYGGSAEEG